MCIQRLRYAQEKQLALAKQGRREVAQLLGSSKEQKAHYRVESLINDDVHIELLEILELYSELLHARVMILNNIENEAEIIELHMDDGINEAVRSIVFATLHVPEVKELVQMRDLLTMKFGSEFLKFILDERLGVPEKIVSKCSPKLPAEDLVELYLKEIARTYNVPYSLLDALSELEDSEAVSENDEPANKSSDESDGKPIVAGDIDNEMLVNDNKHPITIRRPRKNSETLKRNFKIPKEIKKDIKVIHNIEPIKKSSADDELDDLKKRFAALRK